MNFSQQRRDGLNNQSHVIELDPYDSFLREYETIPHILYYEAPIVVFAFGTILNLLLLTYLIKAEKYLSPLFTLITSLCVSDLITCICSLSWPIFLYPIMIVPGTDFMCPVTMFVSNAAVLVSTYQLVFFSMMRFYQLCYPLKARSRVTVQLVFRVCLCISFIGYVSQIPLGVLSSKRPVVYRNISVDICDFLGNYRMVSIATIAIWVIIPFVTICFFHIYKHIRVSQTKINAGQERRNTDARALAIVLVLFFVAWCPILLHDGSHEFFNVPTYSFHYTIFHTSSYFALANSALNPLVYSLASKTIRSDLVNTLFPGMGMCRYANEKSKASSGSV